MGGGEGENGDGDAYVTTYGVMGMLDFWRDPREEEEDAAFPTPLGDEDAPFCCPLADLAELARMSLRNWSLFILADQWSHAGIIK